MNIVTKPIDQSASKLSLAAQYRITHQSRLMLLTTFQGQQPTRSEFCRIKSVETLAPDLWITVGFFDGSTKGLRPKELRVATEEEQRFAQELLNQQAL